MSAGAAVVFPDAETVKVRRQNADLLAEVLQRQGYAKPDVVASMWLCLRWLMRTETLTGDGHAYSVNGRRMP